MKPQTSSPSPKRHHCRATAMLEGARYACNSSGVEQGGASPRRAALAARALATASLRVMSCRG
eukprot:5649612-Alexandrium_andersonii.AAC.2